MSRTAAFALCALAVMTADASAQYATGGSGRFRNNIIWFDWGTHNTPIPNAGRTVTNSYTLAGRDLDVTCTVDNITLAAGSATAPYLRVYRPGTFGGDGLDNLYNIGGIDTANTLHAGLANITGGTMVRFRFACSATLDGAALPLPGIVFADAETSVSGSNEFVQAQIASTGTFRLIDRFRTAGCTEATVATFTPGASDVLRLGGDAAFCADGPMAVAFMEGVSTANVWVNGGGVSAVALGVVPPGTDFGDAPASYGVAGHLAQQGWSGGAFPSGASNAFGLTMANLAQPAVRLGATLDAEPAQLSSAGATGDGADEDALAAGRPGTIPLTAPGTTYTLNTIACAGGGTVRGWIDFNQNNVFDNPSERSNAATCTAGSVSLTWTVPAGVQGGATFLRLRTATAAADIDTPTGLADTGEAEDYALLIQPTFGTCDASMYLSQSAGTPPTTLYRFNTATNPFVFTPLGVNATNNYNAIAYNPNDNYLYGMRIEPAPANVLVRIGNDGSVVALGAVAGLPDVTYNAGEIGPDGTYYVRGSGSQLYRVNLTTRVATAVGPAGGLLGADLAWFNGLLWSAWDVAGVTTLFSINPTTGAITTIGSTGGPSGFGGMIGASNGVFGSSNNGGFYRFNPLTGAATLISNSPGAANNDAAKCVLSALEFPADVAITKTDNSPSYQPGGSVTYTIVARNNGPFGTAGALVNDPLPSGITTANWTCGGATGGGVCGATSGSGAITNVPVNLPAGATVTFTMNMTVPPAFTGDLVNTATITNPPGTPDPNPGNNTSTDTNRRISADLAISKSGDPNPYIPGAPFTYTIVVTNLGPDAAPGAQVSDPLPAPVAGFPWTCVASGGAVCVTPNGVGTINATVDLPVGGSATYTVTGVIAPLTTGAMTNTATITPPPNVIDPAPGNNTATDNNPANVRADLSVTKVSTPNPYVPGQPLTYTMVANNNGPSAVVGARIQDALPPEFASFTWTCVGTPLPLNATCGTVSGTGSIDLLVDMLPGSTITITATGPVPSSYTGVANNTVTITPPPGVTDPIPGNNTSTVQNPPGPEADLQIVKTQAPNPHIPGSGVSYSIVVTNNGPSDVTNARVQDAIMPELTAVTWLCVPGSGAACATPAGVNAIDTLVSIPSGAQVTFTITATVVSTATGLLTNSATVTPPADVTDPIPGNNTSTTNSNPTFIADLAIVKTMPATYVPGQPLTYSIVVTNNGPGAAFFSRVQDAFPPAFSSFSWTCATTLPNTCHTPAGSGTIDALVTVIPGGIATFTVTGTVAANATGTLANTATVTPSLGTQDPDPTNNQSTDTTTATPEANLTIVKSVSPNPYVPGGPLTYTLVVTNAGPSDAIGATVQDPLPAPLGGFGWICAATPGAACSTPSGTGAINTTVDVPVGATVTFTVTGTVPSNTTGTLTNTATVTPPPGTVDPDPGPNTSITTTPPAPQSDLSVVKTSSPDPYVPGAPFTYNIVVSNTGPSDAVGALVQDTLPAPLSAFTWTCTPSAGAACGTASGTGNISVAVDVAVGSTVTFTVSGIVPSSSTAPLTNTATVTPPPGTTDPDPGDNTSTITTPPGLSADLSIVKTASPDPYVPGTTLTYNVVVTNLGPSDVTNALVTDTLPAPLAAFTWTCNPSPGASCATPNGVGNISAFVNVPAGRTVTFTVSGEVAPDLTGPLTNTATVTPPPGTTDPDSGNNTSTITTDGDPRADLAVSKSSTPNPYVPGGPLTYTIVVSNLGPSTANGTTVLETLPATFTATAWTCTPNGGAACSTASGSGAPPTMTVDLPPGGSTTFVVQGSMSSGATGVVINTAEVVPPPTVTDPVPGNNTTSHPNNSNITADLRITKASTPNPFVPGQPLTYTIIVTNAGPSDVTDARVQDAVPAAFAGFAWNCVPGSGASCTTTSGVGDIDTLVSMTSGSSLTITSTGTVPSNMTSMADNTATVMPPPDVTDPVPGNNTTTTSNPPGPIADLAIVKTLAPDPYVPGSPLVYTITVSNAGPSDALHARVQDAVPPALANVAWTCVAGAGAVCGIPSGSGDIDAMVSVPAGGTVTFTINATVPSNVTGVLNNTATVTPPSTVTDPNPGNNTSTVTSGSAPEADLSVTKTSAPNPYVPGAALTYSIVVRNDGPSDVVNARVQDAFPPAMSAFAWTCVASAGADCGMTTGVSTIDVLVDLVNGASVTFTATGIVPSDAAGSQSNTATVTPPIGTRDPDPTDNTSTTTTTGAPQAELSITKTSSPNPYTPGSPITYTVVVSNAGPSAANGTRVRDIVPDVLQNVTWTCGAVDGSCGVSSGTGSIDVLVNIAPGGTVTFDMTGDVPAGTRGGIVNTAIVLPPPGTIDPTPSNNAAVERNPTIAIPDGPADLQITQEFPGVAPPNGLLTFRLVTKNLGSNTALNPYITGMIPPGTQFVSMTPSAGGTCLPPENPPPPDPITGYPITGVGVAPLRCTWPGLMKPGESHSVEFTVRVAPGTRTGQILWSCFWTWSETEDPYHANNVVDAYLFVDDGVTPVGDLTIQGAALSEGVIGTELPTRVGTPVPMRFWVTNNGPSRSRGQYALILDQAGTIGIDALETQQGWVAPSGPASAAWDTGSLEPGQSVQLNLTVRVLTPSSVKLFAQRIAGIPGDPNASNERATIVLDGYGPAGTAGRWVAVGNVDGAGAGEIVTGAGQGETPQVRVYTGAGADTQTRFFAYERPFLGGVQVASCDIDGNGTAEIITAPGPGRAPTVRVLSVTGGVVTEMVAFDTFEPNFRGGVSIACADLDADGAAEVVVGAGPGRAPEVQVYSVGLATLTLHSTFLAYENEFRGGVRVAAGVYPGRPGWLDPFGIVTTPGPGRAAELRLWSPTGAGVAQVVISSATAGVIPTLGDVNGDGQLDLVIAPDNGRPELVRIYDVNTATLMGYVPGGSPAFPVGVRLAIGTLEGGPGKPELVVGNGSGGHPRVRVVYWPPAGPVQRLEILPLEIP